MRSSRLSTPNLSSHAEHTTPPTASQINGLGNFDLYAKKCSAQQRHAERRSLQRLELSCIPQDAWQTCSPGTNASQLLTCALGMSWVGNPLEHGIGISICICPCCKENHPHNNSTTTTQYDQRPTPIHPNNNQVYYRNRQHEVHCCHHCYFGRRRLCPSYRSRSPQG